MHTLAHPAPEPRVHQVIPERGEADSGFGAGFRPTGGAPLGHPFRTPFKDREANPGGTPGLPAGRNRILGHPLRLLFYAEAVLFALFLGSSVLVWRAVPTEGVKLHGNIDTGIDLLGSRSDVVWIAFTGVGAALGNGALALWLRKRERLASLFLLGTTGLVLLGFSGALWFIFLLNRPS